MLILQWWEPIVSDTFPSQIPLWISVHGIPLHYWTDETIEAIGTALGPIEELEVDKARLRVRVNGLKPLIMKMNLQLPSRKVVEIELEYEKIGKHCFCCKSLDHEDSEKCHCPRARSHHGDRGNLGISQQNTLKRIEETRIRKMKGNILVNRAFPTIEMPDGQTQGTQTTVLKYHLEDTPREMNQKGTRFLKKTEDVMMTGISHIVNLIQKDFCLATNQKSVRQPPVERFLPRLRGLWTLPCLKDLGLFHLGRLLLDHTSHRWGILLWN